MDSEKTRRPPDNDAERRTERGFDIVTLVLAGILALTIAGAIGYGVFNSSQIASTIPFPKDLHKAMTKGGTQPVTEGSAGPQREAGKGR